MNLNKAIETTEKFNKNRISTCISFLPIEKSSPQTVQKDVVEYGSLLKIIHERNLKSEVTVKLHQLGVLENQQLARQAAEKITEYAKLNESFVWIDMERPSTVDITIDIFNELHEKFGNVGICLQTYLKRTTEDAKKLLVKHVPIRLVKGFYLEHDIDNWRDVTKQFDELMEIVLQESKRPCIATHDFTLIEKAKKLIRTHNLQNAEFQFFNGVRDRVALELAKEGFNVRIYIPYGNIFHYLLKGLPTFDNLRHIQRLLRLRKII